LEKRFNSRLTIEHKNPVNPYRKDLQGLFCANLRKLKTGKTTEPRFICQGEWNVFQRHSGVSYPVLPGGRLLFVPSGMCGQYRNVPVHQR